MNLPPQCRCYALALIVGSAAVSTIGLPGRAVEPLPQPTATPIKPVAKPPNHAANSKTPPPAVMDKFFNYLNGNYSLWLGDSRGACSYYADPAGIRADGDDRFFLAKISRGNAGTACRGVLAFRVMQADCKAKKLYEFVREQKDDMRVAGWERYESTLRDPAASRSVDPKAAAPEAEVQSQKALTTICAQ
jgi:hypothetical protein